MTKNSGLASSQTLMIGAAGVVVAALVAVFGLGLFETEEQAPAPQGATSQPETVQPGAEPAVEPEASAEAEPAPAAEPEAAQETASVAEAQPEAEPEQAPAAAILPAPPTFDVVRVETDGNTLVAGVAAGGDRVEILLDRVSVSSAEPGADGKFAAFLTLDPSDQPRLMTLLMHAGEARIASEDQVIIAPLKPVAVADATTTPEPAAAQPGAGQPEQDAVAAAPEPAAEPAATNESVAVAEPATGTEPAADKAATAETEAAPAEPAETEPQVAMAEPGETAAEAADTNAPAVLVLLGGKDGVEVMQPAQTGASPSDLVLDAISYSESGAVELTGRGAAGMNIRAYLDNTAWAYAVIGDTGQWKTQLTDVAPGIYTLRIDQVDASGKVTSRVETPFKREAPEKVAAAEAGSTDPAEQTAPIRVVTIQPGNTLWAIAREQYGEGLLYVRLFEANRDLIRDPDLIYPGQVFEIPRD